MIAAIILGTAIFSLGGSIPFTLMLVFFISSSIISKIGKNKKKGLDKIHEKSDARDFVQVIANGGVAVICLFLFQKTKDIRFFIASAVSFAAANSDTWASEIGVLSKGKTISIITGKKIEKGVSGGISLLGTVSAFLGATVIGIAYTTITRHGIPRFGDTYAAEIHSKDIERSIRSTACHAAHTADE